MNIFDSQLHDFRDLTTDETYACNGGGFAFDVGRFIRFSIISFGGGVNTVNAMGDAIYNMVK